MSINDWFRNIMGKLISKPSGNGMTSPKTLLKIAEQIEHTREIEYSCDEVLALLDQFSEMVIRGEDAARLMPLIQHHLDMCQDCREEFEALLRILRASPV